MTGAKGVGIKHSDRPVHWIIDFLRKQRVKNQLTMMELADVLGVSHSTWSTYETVRKFSTFRQLERALHFFGYKLSITRLTERERALLDDSFNLKGGRWP